MEENQALQLRDDAKQQLMQIKSIESGIEYLNKVKAIETWAKAEKKDAELQNIIAEQKIRTQRILGTLIKQGQESGEIRTAGNPIITDCNNSKKALSEIGITPRQSSTYQRIASIPEPEFEGFIAEKKQAVEQAVNELTTAGMLKYAKESERDERLKVERDILADVGKNKTLDIDFRHGDFEAVFEDLQDGSVDCIITDPPYPFEFIHCWSKLARFAKRVLKPYGFCIAYSGQANLPEVIKRMSAELDYYWTFAVYHEGQTQIVNGVNIMCRWKPVLIYQNGKKKNPQTIQDYFISEQREKAGHDWQQSESGVSYLLQKYTMPSDVVCDPFAGSGTTLKVGSKMMRTMIGAEIDEETYNIAKGGFDE